MIAFSGFFISFIVGILLVIKIIKIGIRKKIKGVYNMIFNKKWTLNHMGKTVDNELSKKLKISPEISQILKNRGIKTEKDSEIFMDPSLDYLRDPFLMKDMEKAVKRIKEAIAKNEKYMDLWRL